MDISAVKRKDTKVTKEKESTKEKAKEKVRATEDTRAKEKETRVTTMEKVQLDLAILLDTKDNNKAKVKEKDTKENKHKTCATDVDNQDTLQRIVEFQSTIIQKHHKQQQNNTICNNGTMIHTRMMDIGGTIVADNTSKMDINMHNNLHYQHHKRQHHQTTDHQSRLYLENNAMNQL